MGGSYARFADGSLLWTKSNHAYQLERLHTIAWTSNTIGANFIHFFPIFPTPAHIFPTVRPRAPPTVPVNVAYCMDPLCPGDGKVQHLNPIWLIMKESNIKLFGLSPAQMKYGIRECDCREDQIFSEKYFASRGVSTPNVKQLAHSNHCLMLKKVVSQLVGICCNSYTFVQCPCPCPSRKCNLSQLIACKVCRGGYS